MIRELIQRPHKAMAIAGGKYGHFTEENLEGIERLEVAVLAEMLRRYLQDKRYISNFCYIASCNEPVFFLIWRIIEYQHIIAKHAT
jgi:hypothetical protein